MVEERLDMPELLTVVEERFDMPELLTVVMEGMPRWRRLSSAASLVSPLRPFRILD